MAGYWEKRILEDRKNSPQQSGVQQQEPSAGVGGGSGSYLQWLRSNGVLQEKSWERKYRDKTYAELALLLEALEDGEEKLWLTDYAGRVDYSERVNLDMDAADREIQELKTLANDASGREQMLQQYRSNPLMMLTNADAYRDMERRQEEFESQYGSLDQLQEQIRKKRQYRAESQQLQDSVREQEELEKWKKTVRAPEIVQQELDAVNRQLEENKGTAVNLDALNSALPDQTGYEQSNQEQKAALKQQTEDLEQQRAALEKELRYGRQLAYEDMKNKADFAEKSQYTPTAQAAGRKTLGEYVTGDNKYDYINRNQQTVLQQTLNEQRSGAALVGMGMDWLQNMTDDEVATYNYLHATQGDEAADEYIAFLRPELTARQRQGTEETMAELAKENPYLMSAISVGTAPMRGISLIGQAADYMTDGRIDQNAGYNQFSYANSAIRNQVAQQIQESGKWGTVGSFAYQTAMSMGDFLINAGVGMGISGVSTAIMGSGAAADTVIACKDRGLGDGESFSLGIVAGLGEALTERFSLEALLNPDLLMNGIGKYVLVNSLTEGSEEVASSILNMAADILVTKEKSEWSQSIRNYQNMGYSEGEAFGRALAEQAASLGMDFLGGALSGGIMSGARSATYYADTKQTGRALGRQGLTDAQQVQQILNEGHDADKGTAANTVAAQLQKKVDAGRDLSQYEKGRLYQSNPQTVGREVFGQGSVQLAHARVQGIDNTMTDWQKAKRLASITGRDIRFYNGNPIEDGQYDPKTGEIFINVDRAKYGPKGEEKQNDVAYVFAHELTHSVEISGSYNELLSYIRGKIKAEGNDWDQMVQDKKDAYAAEGHTLESDADAEAELVAVEVQNRILCSEQEMYDLFWEQPTIGQKILSWFEKMLMRLRNKEYAREWEYIHKTQQLLLNAKEDADRARKQGKLRRSTQSEPQAKQSAPQEAKAPSNLSELDEMYREQYRSGELTEEEYEEYLAWREHEAAAEEGQEAARQYSIARTKNMEWDKQIRSVLQKDGYIVRNDTLVVDKTPEVLKNRGISDRPLAIPLSIITKAKSGKDISHSINNKNLRRLQHGIRNASAIIHDPNRNSIAFVTNIEQNGAPVLAAFQKDAVFDGDQVHKATSIHLQIDVASMLNALPPEATVYVQNKNELNKWVGVTNNLRSLAANVEFTEDSVTDLDKNVKQYSLAPTTLSKRDVARDLRAILSRGGDPRELQRYVSSLEQSGRNAEQNRENRYQNTEKRYQTRENRNSTAREILEAAHSQGQSVEEYLRWNPEQFEVDGKWRPEALEAMRMEQGGRQYSLGGSEETSEAAEPQARVIQRENLPAKAQTFLRRAETKLLNSIGEAMSVPRYARYNTLRDIIQEISNEYLAEGTISDEKWACCLTRHTQPVL